MMIKVVRLTCELYHIVPYFQVDFLMLLTSLSYLEMILEPNTLTEVDLLDFS